MSKKIGLEELLKRKQIIENIETSFNSQELGGKIEFEKINPSKVTDLVSEIDNGLTQYQAYQKLIYISCMLFRSKELISQYDIAEPYEVVGKVFNDNIQEIIHFGNLILSLYGFSTGVSAKLKKH